MDETKKREKKKTKSKTTVTSTKICNPFYGIK